MHRPYCARSLQAQVNPMSLAIVGIDYPNQRGPGRRFELRLCTPGEPVELRPEPKNPKDEYAVAVYSCRNVQLGYLTAERAPWIGAMLREGRELRTIYQGRSPTAGWLRLAFDGEEPILPVARVVRPVPSDDVFWPDTIYCNESEISDFSID